ncbi:MAG: hypothetical protein HY340_03270 [Candidatus Kerfeldbacteria bacterium]|nr:hypothetical protein [Candidatus Kerfeldbacteria bacterium]
MDTWLAPVLFGVGMLAYIIQSEVRHARKLRRWRAGESPFIVRGDQPLGSPDD